MVKDLFQLKLRFLVQIQFENAAVINILSCITLKGVGTFYGYKYVCILQHFHSLILCFSFLLQIYFLNLIMEMSYDTMVIVDHPYYPQNWFAVYVGIVRLLVETYLSITR